MVGFGRVKRIKRVENKNGMEENDSAGALSAEKRWNLRESGSGDQNGMEEVLKHGCSYGPPCDIFM